MLLITCCQIRAVRLELLSDLSVDAFLMALTRAASRGVNPHTVLSDNGGNFEGTNKLLRHLWAAMPLSELNDRRPDIKWRFNPPYASHYGGVFERLIRAAKQALYHALPAHLTLTLEQLTTTLTVVEGILNARPLSYVSSHPLDLSPITPNHFLYGSGSLPVFQDLMALGAEAPLPKRFNTVQKATRNFCLRFHREVLPALQATRRLKQKDSLRDVQVGDVVTFFLPSNAKKWPLAIVSAVYPGRDGRVRTIQIKLPGRRENEKKDKYEPLPPKFYVRDVGEVAVLLPAEPAVDSAAGESLREEQL